MSDTQTTAVLFQALPPLAPDEYRALEESIETHGIQVPVVVDESGVVIDGHHRQKIAHHLGLECPTIIKSGYTDAEKRTLALSLNIDRRQLNREQKRALIAESIKADPQLSDREHGRRTGASDKTAGAIRKELESGAEIPHLEMRDNPQGRPQPASKPRPTIDPADPALDADVDPESGADEPFGNSEELEPATEIAPGLTAYELAALNPTTSQSGKRLDGVKVAQRIAKDLEGIVFSLSMLDPTSVVLTAEIASGMKKSISTISRFVREVEING